MSAFDNATLMITGGTGSFGSTVLKHFLDSDLRRSVSSLVMKRSRMICAMSFRPSTRRTPRR